MIIKTFNIIAAIILITGCGTGQGNLKTAGFRQVKEQFHMPGQSSGVNCWWWWLNGNVDREAISSDLKAMKDKGFQGAMIFDAGGHNQRGNADIPAGPRFGSEDWIDLFVFALDEAERLGLEIGVNIQSGWNLGGPGVTPEKAAKRLTYSLAELEGGSDTDIVLEKPGTRLDYYRDIAVLAFPLDRSRTSPAISHLGWKLSVSELGGSAPDCRFLLENQKDEKLSGTFIVNHEDILDLSANMDPDGRFKWSVPDGEWAVLRFGYTCTGSEVSTSSDTWQGLTMDYLRKECLDDYLRSVVDPILEAAGHHTGTTLTSLETDSWECGGMNWTDRFAEDFLDLNGYDILSWLPVAAGFVVDDMDASHAFMADFRKTVGYDVAHNHYERFAEYAHAHGLGIQPECSGPHAGPFDGVRNYSFSDIVMSEFWAPSPHRPKDSDRFFLKQASSAAHIYGKKIVGAESFTTIGPHWNDEIWHSQKPAFDHEICAGLNRVYFHTFTCSPSGMGLPGQEYFAGTHINPRLTWWNEAGGFIDYMHRVQSVVQESRFCADVLYYYGDHVPVIYPFKHSDMAGCMPGFDYDVTSEDALLLLEADRHGFIRTPSGGRYRLLVLPDHRVLSLAALKKVAGLIRGGATVLGAKPERCISLKGGDEAQKEFATLADEVWGHNSASGQKSYGKGRAVWGTNAREYLLSGGLEQDFSIKEDRDLKDFDFIHYSLDGRDVYFISSFRDVERDVNCRFRVSGRSPELWDAMDGSIRELKAYVQADGCTDIPLHFEPCGSAMIVFDRHISPDASGTGDGNHEVYSLCSRIEGPWDVAFDPEWGGPDSVRIDSLTDWTLSENEGIKYYSGTAVYTGTFDSVVPAEGKRYFITLGSVKDTGMAHVSLNGTDLGTVWARPFRVEITGALKGGENKLEVKVTNSWYNRVAGDRISPEGKHFTATNINLAVDYRGRPTQTIALSPSGLLGPVEIYSL